MPETVAFGDVVAPTNAAFRGAKLKASAKRCLLILADKIFAQIFRKTKTAWVAIESGQILATAGSMQAEESTVICRSCQ